MVEEVCAFSTMSRIRAADLLPRPAFIKAVKEAEDLSTDEAEARWGSVINDPAFTKRNR